MIGPESPRAPVSVVIPCYNGHEVIGRSLHSVCSQTLSVSQIIVVDDGSTDDTAQIVSEQFPQVTLIRQSNQGFARAVNAGLRSATCDLICPLSADDEWMPNKIERQIRALAERPEIDLLGCTTVWTAEGAQSHLPEPPDTLQITQLPLKRLLLRHRLHDSGIIVRKRVLEQIGLYEEGLRTSSDVDFFLRAAAAGFKVARLEEPLVIGYTLSSGLTRSFGPLAADIVSVREKWDPHGNPDSPLTPREYGNAMGANYVLAAYYCLVDGDTAAAHEYLTRLSDLDCSLGWNRLAGTVGRKWPGLLRLAASFARRVVRARPVT